MRRKRESANQVDTIVRVLRVLRARRPAARGGLRADCRSKRALIERFAALGFQRVEATSYSNPKVVPQFADASALLASLTRRDGVHYKATCANVRAVERALADLDAGFGVTEISLLVSASEAHSMKNLRQSRADQWENVRTMAAAAQGRFRLIGTISVAFGCPFEGAVDPGVVVADAMRFAEAGVDHVALGDTTGMATPASHEDLVGRCGASAGRHPDRAPARHARHRPRQRAGALTRPACATSIARSAASAGIRRK